jgi:hypothetical protein
VAEDEPYTPTDGELALLGIALVGFDLAAGAYVSEEDYDALRRVAYVVAESTIDDDVRTALVRAWDAASAAGNESIEALRPDLVDDDSDE